MIAFPCAKINLGLNIVSKRADGYHTLETVFYPVPLTDALEIKTMDEKFPSATSCDLKITGNGIDGEEEDNLVCRAYRLLAEDFSLPRVHTHLYKRIPAQAGLGGGSSDAAYMIKLLDERFRLNIGIAEMERYAARLGADCAFFITSEPAFATGIGEQLVPMSIVRHHLSGYFVGIVKPKVVVSTREAFTHIRPQQPAKCCKDIVTQPVETWRETLTNNFETPIFAQYPELADIKQQLYRLGAVYAQMSGSGSALFGIFKEEPRILSETFQNSFTFTAKL